MSTSTADLLSYYSSLLIMQYANRPRAVGTIKLLASLAVMPQTTVQVITFPAVPDAGAFTLLYGLTATVSIPFAANAASVQADLRAISGLSGVTVTGSAALGFTVTFTGVTPPAALLTVGANTLTASSVAVVPVIAYTDLTLPLAVLGGFNLVGSSPAIGKQLDTLGKYAGVTRYGVGTLSNITLSDSDFLSLIRIAIIANSSNSDLASIQSLIHTFFAGQILVFDYQSMRMTYLISSSLGSQDLMQVLVSQNLLPRPMAVGLSVIYAPVVTKFYSFRTYTYPAVNASPLNSYSSYQTNRPWLSYANSITVP